MTPKLQRRFASLERTKATMLQTLSTWTPEQLAFRPKAGARSAAEILNHIAHTEGTILHAVRGNLAHPQPMERKDRLTSFVVRCIMRAPLPVSLPAPIPAVQPNEAASPTQAIADWQQARSRWCHLVTSATHSQIEGGVFSHPRGGWMSLADTLLFLRLHHEHYLHQLDRLQKSLPLTQPPHLPAYASRSPAETT